MVRHLPSLSSVRVFEAAARKLSFTLAAEELGMTQAAVSYQIRLLEQQVGAQLFLRHARGVVLTELGQRITPRVTDALDLLNDVFSDELHQEQETLLVSTTNGFAALWLVPRLDDLRRQYPSLVVKVETTDRIVDFAMEAVDVAIRAGQGNWPGLIARKIQDVDYTPMLSPALSQLIGPLVEPADMLRFPLIDSENPWWLDWFTIHDLPIDHLKAQTAPSLNTQIFSASAALDGLGVALLTPAYHQRALLDGKLIRPFSESRQSGWSYWITYPESRRRSKKIATFQRWLQSTTAGGAPSPSPSTAASCA